MARGGEVTRVKVWDLPTRVFHWTLAAAVAGSWYTGENGMTEWHERLGLSILALLGFRLIWGFVGGRYARFTDFVCGPVSAFRYLKETLAGRHPLYLGHNPLGGWSVVALLIVLAVQASMGLFGNDDILYEGPLYSLVTHDLSARFTGWHILFFNIVLTLVIIHITAVVAYAVLLKTDLIRPMITGWKQIPIEDAPDRIARTPAWIAAVLFAGCAVAAWALTLVD
ncbi:cytochrome B561 [alpha proteobacterium BAL199]|jgi:cytochrome b|nr:cytochrome B561 [alpha proteobacterium BAL199]